MDIATTADIAERDARRYEKYRHVTHRSYLWAAIGFLGPCLLILVTDTAEGRLDAPVAFAAAVGLGLMMWMYTRLVRAGLGPGLTRREFLTGGALAAALSLLVLSQPVWSVPAVFWVSAVALTPLPRGRVVALCAVTAAYLALLASLALRWNPDPPPLRWFAPPLLFAVFFAVCAFTTYINLYQRRTWTLHQEAHAAREALATVAVTEERLRFSRDLHDLLGHSLSLIAVKSELAMRMTERDPDRARAEMADVRTAAREALREVRAAVRGYRAVELDAELAGARAVLEAAGVRCAADVPPRDLPPDVATALAWAIREGTTNVIKHSRASACAIRVGRYGASVILEMDNDGVTASAEPPGSGLDGLRERLAVVGGTLDAAPHGRDRFLLRAVVADAT
ncbi:sensor histidine kinase [Actinomadura flavalba]|uniref:sensor histidine kinase n=1 Tax=Actinomadura flavalba TaxID=1120938 RepID=UPI0003770080|nr:sensor histidine kinase [Actinomadura flavalba]